MILAPILLGLHALGAVTALGAILRARTSQAAFAWAVGLVAFPYLSLPLYWIFGRTHFHGYVTARRSQGDELRHELTETVATSESHRAGLPAAHSRLRALEQLAGVPFTSGNDAQLLIDGDATYAALCEGIREARDYVLVEFYILRSDAAGQQLKQALLERLAAGVRVALSYDRMASRGLDMSYQDELRAAGAEVRPFVTTRGARNRFQLNFRNHRKIVVVDGRVAFLGGLNIGVEYQGLGKLGLWRDTHMRVEGPIVQSIQLAWVQDWHWTGGDLGGLEWEAKPAAGASRAAVCVASGPADELETYSAYAVALINSARERVWIASPYFVPDEAAMRALQLAALRGVAIRVLIPEEPDKRNVQLAAFAFMPKLADVGVEFFFYRPGFMHQKVILVDDELASVGTANFDNRSFRLNFEIVACFLDRAFAADVERMLQKDFDGARPITTDDYAREGLLFRIKVRASYLLAQVM